MKIGIVSYWDSQHNYGQILQCFAMQQFLRDIGHEPYHIRYKVDSASFGGKIQKLLKAFFAGDLHRVFAERRASHDSQTIERIQKQIEECKLHPRGFNSFKEKYIDFTPGIYNYAELKANPPHADVYIAGSDQIWGTPDPGFMLNFGSPGVKRIAYAPSLGGVSVAHSYMKHDFKKLLKQIDVVTVREADGVEQCRLLGSNAKLVPDPVFLIPKEIYRQIAVPPMSDLPYLFVYLLGNPIDIDMGQIEQWADQQGLAVKYVAAQGRFDDYEKLYPNVDEWIGLIDNAKYVITNSFHGMVMSIILNKQFLVLPICGEMSRMNSRLSTTLEKLGLISRVYSGNLDAITSDVNYDCVNAILETQRMDIVECFNTWLLPS